MFLTKMTENFVKSYRKLSEKEKKAVDSKLKIFAQNPFHPSLRTKKYKGYDALFEMSVNMDIRILWRYEGNVIILMLDVGHHKQILGV